jgi:hypothetical protein
MFMDQVLIILIVIIATIAAGIIISAYMTNCAMVKVIRIFRKHEANDIWSAKTAYQLGIGPRSLMDQLKDPRRDYKPMALMTLIKFGIVRQTGNEKLYLNEKSLSDFCNQTEHRIKACSLALQKNS